MTPQKHIFNSKEKQNIVFLGDDIDEDQQVEEGGRVRRYSIGERRKQIRDQAFGRGAMTERNKLLMAVSIIGSNSIIVYPWIIEAASQPK